MKKTTWLALGFCLISILAIAKEDRLTLREYDLLVESVELYRTNRYDKSVAKAGEIGNPHYKNVLYGRILLSRGKHGPALKEVLKSDKYFESKYHRNKQRLRLAGKEYNVENMTGREFLVDLYFHLASFVKAHVYFRKEMWGEALPNLVVLTMEKPRYIHLFMLGVCYYKVKDMDNALARFLAAYDRIAIEEESIDDPGDLRQMTAYNISVVFAVKLESDNAIRWLKVPLGYDSKKWLKEVESNKDFDKIRNERKFKQFLDEFRTTIPRQ